MYKRFTIPAVCLIMLFCACLANAQEPEGLDQEEPITSIEINEDASIDIPQSVEDESIQKRIEDIMSITPWFMNVTIKVHYGVVVLSGMVDQAKHKDWLFDVIKKTDGVIAWVDQLDFQKASIEDLKPDFDAFSSIIEKTKDNIPYFLIALIILFFTLLFTFVVHKLTKIILSSRLESQLIVDAIAKLTIVPVLILGFYAVLKSTGLSGLATTLVGGTSIIGLIIGFSLKGFFENYFASLAIRFKNIFHKGDYIEVDGIKGVVQNVNSRGTTLMDFEGNHITVPNSRIFTGIVKNFVTNPNMRGDFVIGIDYKEDISDVTMFMIEALENLHDIVLIEPKPFVLVDSLGSATVNMRAYFWCNSSKHSLFKVRSLAMQVVKEKLMLEKISLPDDAREIIIPNPIQIQTLSAPPKTTEKDQPKEKSSTPILDVTTDIEVIKKQIDENPLPDEKKP